MLMRVSFIAISLYFAGLVAAHAECYSPGDKMSFEDIRQRQNASLAFWTDSRIAEPDLKYWKRRSYYPAGSDACFQLQHSMQRSGNIYLGSFAINNSLIAGAEKNIEGRKSLVALVIRLDKKRDTQRRGHFNISLKRQSGCKVFRNGKSVGSYFPGTERTPRSVQALRKWNNVHDSSNAEDHSDKPLEGKYHGAADKKNATTTWQQNEKFKIADDLIKKYNVTVQVRTYCHRLGTKDQKQVKMIKFPVQSGNAGLILRYFSPDYDLDGIVRFCAPGECGEIETVSIRPIERSLFARFFGL